MASLVNKFVSSLMPAQADDMDTSESRVRVAKSSSYQNRAPTRRFRTGKGIFGGSSKKKSSAFGAGKVKGAGSNPLATTALGMLGSGSQREFSNSARKCSSFLAFSISFLFFSLDDS